MERIEPRISIITPVWNGLPYLKECVESLLMQEFTNWEMLVSDDGSTDGSREYLETLDDDRILIYKQDVNLGIFGNLNFLISKAKAAVCQLLCQDDYFFDQQSLSKIIYYWSSADERIGFVRFNNEAIARCSLTKLQKSTLPSVVASDKASLLFYLFGNIPGNLSNISLRTTLVEEMGGFNQALPFAGDFEFWSRAAQKYSMGIECQNVIIVRRHLGAASNFLNKKGEILKQKALIITRLFDDLRKNNVKTTFLLRCQSTVNFDSQQRYTGLKLFYLGRKDYIRELESVVGSADFVLPGAWRWLIFVFSLGGRFGRAMLTRRILKVNNII